jgi:hypothetical protein
MLKKMIMLVTIITFSLGSIAISAERDCSNPKGFHNKLMCKQFNTASTDDDSEKKEGGGLLKFFPKSLKEFNEKKTLF